MITNTLFFLQDVNSLDVDLALEAHSLAFRDPSEWRFVVSEEIEID